MTARIDRRARPPGARFFPWEAPDGARLRRMDWPAPEGSGRGSLLFVSGRGDFMEKYLEAFGHWHDRGWHVASFDWRGQGLSDRSDREGRDFSFDPMVADLGALIDDWTAHSPAPHFVIAHSMGGHLLLRLLTERPTGLNAAVLVAPMIEVNSHPFSAAAARRIAGFLCRIGRAEAPVWKSPTSPRAAARRGAYLTRCAERYADEMWWRETEPALDLGSPSWGWLDAAFRSAAAFAPERLAAIDLPILLLATATDRLVSSDAIQAAVGHLPRAELVLYPDAGHEILREADPIRLDALSRIDLFLDRDSQ